MVMMLLSVNPLNKSDVIIYLAELAFLLCWSIGYWCVQFGYTQQEMLNQRLKYNKIQFT